MVLHHVVNRSKGGQSDLRNALPRHVSCENYCHHTYLHGNPQEGVRHDKERRGSVHHAGRKHRPAKVSNLRRASCSHKEKNRQGILLPVEVHSGLRCRFRPIREDRPSPKG